MLNDGCSIDRTSNHATRHGDRVAVFAGCHDSPNTFVDPSSDADLLMHNSGQNAGYGTGDDRVMTA